MSARMLLACFICYCFWGLSLQAQSLDETVIDDVHVYRGEASEFFSRFAIQLKVPVIFLIGEKPSFVDEQKMPKWLHSEDDYVS